MVFDRIHSPIEQLDHTFGVMPGQLALCTFRPSFRFLNEFLSLPYLLLGSEQHVPRIRELRFHSILILDDLGTLQRYSGIRV
jgi:hypothetical protein